MGEEINNRMPDGAGQGSTVQSQPSAGQLSSQNQPPEDMTIEQAFARLQQILAGMEREGTTLEESFRQYEEGMKLVKLCSSKIDRVEKKVQMMNADGTTTDFE